MQNTSVTHKPQQQKRDVNEQPSVDTGLLQTNKKVPYFSDCIPTYNRASFLPQAIESVPSQDFADFELIICDNASTDDTQAIVSQYQDDLIRYGNLVNMWANHNRCIKLASSDWLIFLHSDDRFNTNALSVIKNELSKFEELDILAPYYDYIQPYRNILQSQENQVFFNSGNILFFVLSIFCS
jgi:glycosyltransferase involved in cell wall biosynthesis